MAVQMAPAEAEIWQGKADIEFRATSTLHDFSGTVRAQPFAFLAALDGTSATLGGTAAVAVVRSDKSLSSAVGTVDDIGAESGRITAVLALQNLINGRGTGSYGVGQGATSVTVAQ